MYQIYALILSILLLSACSLQNKPGLYELTDIQSIAFGSCNKQDLDQSFWTTIQAKNPDLWIWLGDNIYADTEDMSAMQAKYQQQKTNPHYQRFIEDIPITGIWDDHDYGQNDGNHTFAFKEESKQHFLDFLDIAKDNPVNLHPGIYRSETFGLPPKQIKIIHLDTRTFQDPLEKAPQSAEKNYVTHENGQLLGTTQWQWLTDELTNSQANINIITSSLQVIAEDHRYEMWSNFPSQREQLFNLVVSSGANNPLFMSGDRHLSEISELVWKGQKLIDITSSGLTHSFSGNEEYNQHRVGNLITTESFSMLTIDWSEQFIDLQQYDMESNLLNSHLIGLK